MCLLTEIDYRPDSAELFQPLARRPWAVWLDSGRPASPAGRYDILAADPMMTLTTQGAWTTVTRGETAERRQEDPLVVLREAMGPVVDNPTGLPFVGGALGWFGYDLGRRYHRLASQARDTEQLPELAIGIYDWAVVVDHQAQRSWLVGQGRDPATRRRWLALQRQFNRPPAAPAARPLQLHGPLHSNLDRAAYNAAFARIQQYIHEGDCYQVNFAQRFAAPASGDGWAAYQRLRQLNPAPFAAYVTTPYGELLSSSPERLLAVDAGQIETRPIKGTRPRGQTAEADAALARELQRSAKDRAENLMIVDLLRNDLGRVCTPGSVAVPGLFELESYATVHHLVSTVTGRLAPGQDVFDLIRACFPGGSITGAPKLRAMQIIEELEPHRRGLYCGSVGYVGMDGRMDLNILIRSLVYNQGEIRCWAGGGIVHDSRADAEYQETFDKAAAMLRLLDDARLADVGG